MSRSTGRNGRQARSLWPAFWVLLPFHALLPYVLQSLHRRVGFEGASYAVAGIHLVFPLVYLPVSRWLPQSVLELLLLLLLNHAVILVVGVVLWLGPR